LGKFPGYRFNQNIFVGEFKVTSRVPQKGRIFRSAGYQFRFLKPNKNRAKNNNAKCTQISIRLCKCTKKCAPQIGSPGLVYSHIDTKTITMSFVYVKEPSAASLSMAQLGEIAKEVDVEVELDAVAS